MDRRIVGRKCEYEGWTAGAAVARNDSGARSCMAVHKGGKAGLQAER
jgi:hypothetical protein